MSEVAEQIKKLNDRVGKLEEKVFPVDSELPKSDESGAEASENEEEEEGSGSKEEGNEGAGS